MFADRVDAGRRLAAALSDAAAARPIVFALPRGGVPVAAEIARALRAPLELLLARKIGVPDNPELAMGAVVEGDPPLVVRNADVVRACAVSDETFAAAQAREERAIATRRALWRDGRAPISPRGRVAILVDDGIATGATAKVGLRALRELGAGHALLAIPVAPRDTLAAMAREADRVVCLEAPDSFWGVSGSYRDFRQLRDEEVSATLAMFQPATRSA